MENVGNVLRKSASVGWGGELKVKLFVHRDQYPL